MAVTGKTTAEQNRHYDVLDALRERGDPIVIPPVVVPAPIVNVTVSTPEVVIPPVKCLSYRTTVESRDQQGKILTVITEPLDG